MNRTLITAGLAAASLLALIQATGHGERACRGGFTKARSAIELQEQARCHRIRWDLAADDADNPGPV